MINTSLNAPKSSLQEALNVYARKLLNSGHGLETVRRLLVQAATCYLDKVRRANLNTENAEYKPLYLSKHYKQGERILLKKSAKCNWFHGKRKSSWRQLIPKEWKEHKLRQRTIKGIDVTTVIIVPNTNNSCLLNKLIQKEAQLGRITGYNAKLVEGNGIPIIRLLPPPLQTKNCHRNNKCLICSQDDTKQSR